MIATKFAVDLARFRDRVLGTRLPITSIDACRALATPPAMLSLGLALSSVSYAQSMEEGSLRQSLDLRLDVSYMYDTNVNRAPNGQQRLTDQFYSLNATAGGLTLPLNTSTRLVLDGAVGGDMTRFFPKLGRVFGEFGAALQYRKSADFYDPTFSLFGRITPEHFGSSQRRGYQYSVGVSALQPVTDRINWFGVLAHHERNANSSVFDANDNSAQVTLDYSIGPHGTFYLTGEYRRGDVVSTGPESLVNLDIAKVFVQDDAYTNPQLISYRFEAKSYITMLGYNMPVGPSGSLDFSWRWAQSTPTQSAGFPGAETPRYVDNQFMILYAMRF